ncbi:FxLYD domain-containing protein [Streptomyces chryseus]
MRHRRRRRRREEYVVHPAPHAARHVLLLGHPAVRAGLGGSLGPRLGIRRGGGGGGGRRPPPRRRAGAGRARAPPASPRDAPDASDRASPSAAATSASPAATSFEASVSADTARANAAATAELKKVRGGGNARSDVSLTGKPRAQTGGVLAVVVTITNSTDQQASYAVQVDFADPSGKVVETRIVGAQDLDPGEKVQPLAISRKPAEPVLTPRIAKAQRY